MANRLLLHFRDDDTDFGVTRTTLANLANAPGMSETQTMHFAFRKLANERLPAYEMDDGALSKSYVEWLNNSATIGLDKGKLLSRKSLL